MHGFVSALSTSNSVHALFSIKPIIDNLFCWQGPGFTKNVSVAEVKKSEDVKKLGPVQNTGKFCCYIEFSA